MLLLVCLIAAPHLLADLTTDVVPAGSSISTNSEQLNGKAIFALQTAENGAQLISTDGVTIEPLSPPLSHIANLFRFGDHVYFKGIDTEHGQELWRTDGTPAGTILMHDMSPGPLWSGVDSFAILNGYLYYRAPALGTIWRTNGISVEERFPLVTQVLTMKGAQNHLYLMETSDGGSTYKLWQSDGTSLSGVTGATTLTGDLAVVGDSAIVSASVGGTNTLLVSHSGAALTALPSVDAYTPHGRPIEANGGVYFQCQPTPGQTELCYTDGASAEVIDLYAGGGGSDVSDIAGAPNLLAFASIMNDGLGREPTYIGVAAPTAPLRMADLETGPGFSNPKDFLLSGSRVFFRSSSLSQTFAWTAPSGVVEITSQIPYAQMIGAKPLPGDQIIYLKPDASIGAEPWVSGPQVSDFHLIENFAPDRASSNPRNFVEVGGTLFFSATNPAAGREIFTLEGPIGDNFTANNEVFSLAAGAHLLFANNAGIFTHDGTTTQQLQGPSGPSNLLPALGEWVYDGSNAYIIAREPPDTSRHLYRVNGATVTRIGDPASAQYFEALLFCAGRLFVAVYTPPGYVLHELVGDTLVAVGAPKSQGTSACASFGQDILLVEDGSLDLLHDGGESALSDPQLVVEGYSPLVIGSRAYVTAFREDVGTELFQSDGQSLQLVKDIYPGQATSVVYFLGGNDGSNDQVLYQAGGRAIFIAVTPEYGAELWTSDGSSDGTHLLKDIVPGPNGSSPAAAFYWAPYDRLLFTAGGEVWITDGTIDGTQPLTHFADPVAKPGEIYANSGAIYFAKTDTTGREPWVIDDVTEDTQLSASVSEACPDEPLVTLTVTGNAALNVNGFDVAPVLVNAAGCTINGLNVHCESATEVTLRGHGALTAQLVPALPDPDTSNNVVMLTANACPAPEMPVADPETVPEPEQEEPSTDKRGCGGCSSSSAAPWWLLLVVLRVRNLLAKRTEDVRH